jgi:integrase
MASDHDVVVYPVNPKTLDRARDQFRQSGAKSDPFDARVLADFLRTDHAHLRVLRPSSAAAQELKLLAEDYQRQIRQQTRRGSRNSGLVFGTRKWDHFRSAWERAVDRAKLVDFHFHDLRHTFASWAVQRGASLQEVKDLLGHRSLAMTLRYGHLAPEHLRSAVARLDATLPTKDSAQDSAQEARFEEALLSK